MATYSKQKNLVLNLLRQLPEADTHKLATENDIGNTILHESATSNRIVPAAGEMLRRAPELLELKNLRGETALFRAARYGKMQMFRFLDEQVKECPVSEEEEGMLEGRRKFYQRDDKTNILHISILTEHFDLALYIAREHEYLVNVKDGDGMTALQLLSCNPSAFNFGGKKRYLKKLIHSCVSTEDGPPMEEVETFCRVPLWEAIRGKKYQYESAVKLAQLLIKRDISWEATESAMDKSKPKTHKYGVETSSTSQKEEIIENEQKDPTDQETKTRVEVAETPLFLATKTGILEIVEEILNMYPQAVEHIDDEGRNILHVAIKYRQIHILDFVQKLEIPMMRLIRKINNEGNSVLHMVGIKADDNADKNFRSPALLLREDLLLFERVKKISAAHFTKHFNNKGQTAEKLFEQNNMQLREDAKDWLKRTAENCSIVAVLIATVAFAAAYTVPGGPNQDTGYPLLLNQSFFAIFTITDVLSLTFALTSVITFLSILTSSFRMEDFKQSLPRKLMLGVTLLILSVSMMMVAFAATVILLIQNKEQWTRIALYSVAFFPVSIFALSYMPLYIELVKTFIYPLKKIGEAFPGFNCSVLWPRTAKPNTPSDPFKRTSTPQTSHSAV
ncbi:hypothetical protein NMG60_11022509 [Bertholletia excelsa]